MTVGFKSCGLSPLLGPPAEAGLDVLLHDARELEIRRFGEVSKSAEPEQEAAARTRSGTLRFVLVPEEPLRADGPSAKGLRRLRFQGHAS